MANCSKARYVLITVEVSRRWPSRRARVSTIFFFIVSPIRITNGRLRICSQASCKLLSESCNSQVLDTRARHEAQRRAKAAEAAEKRIASRASSPIDSWPYGTDDKKEEKEKKPATKGGRGKKKEEQEDRNQSKLNLYAFSINKQQAVS